MGISIREPGDYRMELGLEKQELRNHPAVRRFVSRANREVNIQIVGKISARDWSPRTQTRRHRPVKVGCSVGHELVTAGTLGCFIRLRDKPGRIGILSNNHVLAASNMAGIGDAILQPGAADKGCPGDKIGSLAASVDLEQEVSNQLDVAAALLDPDIEITGNELPEGPLKDAANPHFDDPELAKVGRTTGLTRGELHAVEQTLFNVEYDFDGTLARLNFTDVIAIRGTNDTPFSQPGDSGSMVYSPYSHIGYALIFAGGHSGGSPGHLSYAVPLPAALDAVNADLALT